MAGGHMKYRHLSRSSPHRKALLRNLVTSLFKNESISTTWPKAKEAQRLAEKLITLAKRDTPSSRMKAQSIFFQPHLLVPKLFTTYRDRYLSRPGGYTRVLRIEPLKEDQAPSAILELVDGPRDMRFALTARTLAFERSKLAPPPSLALSPSDPNKSAESAESTEAVDPTEVDEPAAAAAADETDDSALNDITRKNIAKCIRYRGASGRAELEALASKFAAMEVVTVPRTTPAEEAMERHRERARKTSRLWGHSEPETVAGKEQKEKEGRVAWRAGRWVEREPQVRRVYPTDDWQKTRMKAGKLMTGRRVGEWRARPL